MNPHIQLYFDMMKACYGVNGWQYDQTLNVQFTNSESPNLHKTLLLGLGRREAILAHAAQSDWPIAL